LLDNKPLLGTSTIANNLPKNLTWWAAEMAAVECLDKGILIPTLREEYELAVSSPNKKKEIDKLQRKYPIFKKARFAHYEKKKEKAETGIDMHAELERYINDTMNNEAPVLPYIDKIQPFIEWSKKNVKKFLWSEKHCYSERLWVGGIIDAGAVLKDGTSALIDFKSAREAFLSHYVQAAGYAIGAEESGLLDKNGNLIMKLEKPIEKLLIVPFGAYKVEPQENKLGIGDYKICFEALTVVQRIIRLDERRD